MKYFIPAAILAQVLTPEMIGLMGSIFSTLDFSRKPMPRKQDCRKSNRVQARRRMREERSPYIRNEEIWVMDEAALREGKP